MKTQEECSDVFGRFFIRALESNDGTQKFMYSIFYDNTCINKDFKNNFSRTVKSDHIDSFA